MVLFVMIIDLAACFYATLTPTPTNTLVLSTTVDILLLPLMKYVSSYLISLSNISTATSWVVKLRQVSQAISGLEKPNL